MTLQKIAEIISEQLGKPIESINMDTTLIEDLEADSLDVFQVVNDIEDEFSVKIEDTDGFNTVGDLVRFVDEQSK